MFDLIKTFIANIFVDKRYRVVFVLIAITLFYRFTKWVIVWSQYTMMPVKFVKINDNGSLTFIYASQGQKIYSSVYKLPRKTLFNKCERKYFEEVYRKYVDVIVKSAYKGEFMIKFEKKGFKKYGKIYYDNGGSDEEREIFTFLNQQEVIFDKKQKVDYCTLLRKHHISEDEK